MKRYILMSLISLSGVYFAEGQTKKIDSMLIGVWRGTSICQVKNSPCHDETVVYYISKGKGANDFTVQANKIVNGVEEDMGTVPFVYDENKNALISSAYNSQWNFKLSDNKLDGTLMHQGSLYRIIQLTKSR